MMIVSGDLAGGDSSGCQWTISALPGGWEKRESPQTEQPAH